MGQHRIAASIPVLGPGGPGVVTLAGAVAGGAVVWPVVAGGCG
jgi:hypothetical protein